MSRPGNPGAAKPDQAGQYRAPAACWKSSWPRCARSSGPGTWSSTRGTRFRRAAVRGERLRPAAARAWPVHLALAAVAGIPRGVPRGVHRDGRARLARPPAAGLLRDRRLQPRGDGPRNVQPALQPLVSRGMPGPGTLAGAGSAAGAGRAAANLPDRLLLPVGSRHVGVLLWPRHPLEEQRPARYRSVRGLLREPWARPGAHRPATAARRAPAGDAVRPSVPQRRAGRETAAQRSPPVRRGPGRRGPVFPAGTARRMVDSPLSAEEGARLAPVHPRRAPPRRGARVRRRLGHRVPPGHLAAAQPGHRQARGHLQLRGDPPGLAAGTGQAIRPLAAVHRPVRRHGRVRGSGRDPVRRLARRPARADRRAGRRDPPAAGTLPGRPAGGHGRPGAPCPLRRRAQRLPEGGPPARLGRHAAATAAIYPEDFPPRGARLPRGLAAHVMAQVEQPANLARQATRPTGSSP